MKKCIENMSIENVLNARGGCVCVCVCVRACVRVCDLAAVLAVRAKDAD